MKNKELNLVELLKDIPEGTKFYSPICGEVKFVAINNSNYPITTRDSDGIKHLFTEKGYYIDSGTPECILFPSKEQRDWNVWKAEQRVKHQYIVGDYITLSKGQLLAFFSKIISSDFGIFKIVERNETQFTAHYIDAETIQPICIGIDFLKTIPYCKIDKYPIDQFQPFDKVLCRHSDKDKWKTHFFSHINTGDREYPFYATFSYRYCIPYNLETKHLVGTNKEAPEFYQP